MKFKNKILLPFFVGSLATLPLAVISCENKQTTLSTNLESFNLKYYSLDTSTMLDSRIDPSSKLEIASAAMLFRNETISSPQYDKDTQNVTKPGFYRYKLELASKIILTLKDKSVVEFDTDEIDSEDSQTNKEILKSSEPFEKLYSANQKSINSAYFEQSMKNAIKMQIEVRKNVYWSDTKGQKTQFKVSARDFWYSYLRSYYTGYFQRVQRDHNGKYDEASASDAAARKRFNDQTDRFGALLFTNNQQFDINGINSTKFLEFDENFEAKNALENGKLTFEIKEENAVNNNFLDFWKIMFIKSLMFAAAPSEYINTLLKDDSDLNADVKVNGQGIVRKIGTYYYGVNGWENNLYAGNYIPNSNKSNENKLVFEINDQYLNNGIIQNTKAPKVLEFIKGSITNDDQVSSFNNNKNLILDYSKLNDKEKELIQKDKVNINYYKEYKNAHSIGNTAFNITPAPNLKTRDKLVKVDYEAVAFNNNYAKLVYGATIAEIQQGFKGEFDSKKSISSGVFENASVAFRTLMNAAINWQNLSELNTNLKSQLWLTNAAPDAKFNGIDQNESKYKTPRHAAELINKLIVINDLGDLVELQPETSNNFKSSNFDLIQRNMKELLDRFYQENNLAATEKIKWFIYNNRIWDTQEKKRANEIVNIIKELDTRLEPNLVIKENQKDIDSVIGSTNGNGNNSIAQNIVYNYEYDSLSPYLDKITHAIGLSPFALWYKFAELSDDNEVDQKLKKHFPMMVKFSQTLKAKITDGFIKWNEYYTGTEQNYRKLEWSDLPHLNSYEERMLYLRGELSGENDKKGWSNTGLGGVGYKWDIEKKEFVIDNIAEQSKFARYFVSISKNEELAELLRELNTWRSFNIDLDKSITSLDNRSILITHKNTEIVIPIYDVAYPQDYKITK
ncbi:hypothetical protein C4M96_00680 [Mycoplasmopsis pullorum]|uniref:OppA family ABC transporter substrate-binding lipoprotein n=1 Tax=Mycoplasmopsis pullorum TaxID=48003 RepID=UPI00111907F6|nr:hypothetical protein [Mycoplasmopsis pullorum]TNK83924.1 hypothetical protein C4M93_00725 [Mycoplasmopsis pullorum]TNK92471.1 hypothetical protein C4M96_00680 [Mycoplasmopsis pullorum]